MTHMAQALSLARRALGSVSPNPAVGAVVVKGGRVVGEGHTQPPGGPHAEVVALRQAGSNAMGATLYVTLEPCVHFGRTPPCTQAIIQAGVAEVHAAMLDPNPLVDGRGLRELGEAGIRTGGGDLANAAYEVVEAYAKYIIAGMPFVTAKYAMSLDGKIATRTGDSRWITGEEARRHVHDLRAVSDAIMVGINTVLADNPRLTARDEQDNPRVKQPLRVVVDSRGRLPGDARLLAEAGETAVAVADIDPLSLDGLTRGGAQVMKVPAGDGSVDLVGLLKELGSREITSVLLEGGSRLLGSMFDLGLVDKVIAFIAPTVIGGRAAPSPVGGSGVERVADAMRLNRAKVVEFGDDLAVVGYCNEPVMPPAKQGSAGFGVASE